MRWQGNDAGGTNQDIISGDPDGAASLYHQGVAAVNTITSGIDVRPSSGAAAGRLRITDNDGELAEIVKNTAGPLSIRNAENGSTVQLRADDAAGNNDLLFNGNPDGEATIYYNGVATLRSEDEAAAVLVNGSWRDLAPYRSASWTPAMSFATPGDLSVTYSLQDGYYWKIGPLVFFRCEMATTAFTHTTASGNFRVTGLPFAVDVTNGGVPVWEVQVGKQNDGWGSTGTKAMVKGYGTDGETYIQIFADGVDLGSEIWDTTEFGTGNNIATLRIYGFYETDAAF